MQSVFSNLIVHQGAVPPQGAALGQDLEEMATALAFELPADGRSRPAETTTVSLLNTVVVLDLSLNCFSLEDDTTNCGKTES